MPILFALVGPTAIGKTNLSLKLAKKLNAGIICVDSRQIYRRFCIGTAQPTKEELAAVPHFLTNFLDPNESFSAGDFLKQTRAVLNEFPERPFILVGGTGLYLQTFIDGLPNIPPIEQNIKENVAEFIKNKGLLKAHQKLCDIDPSAGMKILPTDSQRIQRALEVFSQTGRPLSVWQQDRHGGFGKIQTFLLNRKRENLYNNINERVLKMLDMGWVEETKSLLQNISPKAPAWKSLGYAEIVQMLAGQISKNNCIEMIQKETRHFAKRQLTWFRHQTEAHEILLDDDGLTPEKLENRILNYHSEIF